MSATARVARVAACLFGLLACSVFLLGTTAQARTPYLRIRDKKPPSTPTNLKVTATTPTGVTLSWSSSTDNVGVAGYELWRNGSMVATTTPTTYGFSGLACGTAYTLAVDAYDRAGNRSNRASVNASTTACATPPAGSGAPTISGSAQVTQTLASTTGSWSGTKPLSYKYQWQDCDTGGANCAAISGGTSSSYLLASTDQGHTIRVRVTASNSGGSASQSSTPTGVVQAAPGGGGGGGGGTGGGGGGTGGGAAGLHVSGNQLLDTNGNVVHLHGVNYSGPEYACIQGWGIFDGPSDDASINAMASWHINIVRLPLNEDCWLGINGAAAAYSGANYRNAIVNYVNLLHHHGMYAELSLIWGAPGTNQATYQPGAPDEDHSPAFWSSLASTFKNDPDVLLAPWGETIVDANCFLNGGVCEATYGSSNTPYNTAGMQQAVNVMRQAGYNGVIVIPGIDYANDLSQWLSHKPSDPLNQLMAEAHIYGKNTCDTTACFNSTLAPVAASVPLVFGETGETYDDSDCGSSFISTFMNWADSHGVGYEAWTWDTWGTCLSLINNFNGTPNDAYATWVKNHYLSLS